MRNNAYIGLFRTFPEGSWKVSFPDLPGCSAKGSSFKEALEAARHALSDWLSELQEDAPRARSTAELMIDAQRDWRLCREFVDAVMHPVEPIDEERGLAPIDLVAAQAGGGQQHGSPLSQ